MSTGTQAFRRILQAGSLFTLVTLPAVEAYRLLLNFIGSSYVGSLSSNFDYIRTLVPAYANGGYLAWIIIGIDFVTGLMTKNVSIIKRFLSHFTGSFWSLTIGGISFVDPLAFMQAIVSGLSVPTKFIIAAALPMALAVIFGRFFCSWVCPINTLMEISRNITLRIGIRPANKQIFTNMYLKYCFLAVGLFMPVLGITIFPYILPYVLFGRFFYYLAASEFFWGALWVIIAILLVDSLIQRGFWCNYLCPSGALLSLLGKFRPVSIKHNSQVCNDRCSLCVNSCTWQADPRVKRSINCTNCAKCVGRCPTGALSYRNFDPEPELEYEQEEQISA